MGVKGWWSDPRVDAVFTKMEERLAARAGGLREWYIARGVIVPEPEGAK